MREITERNYGKNYYQQKANYRSSNTFSGFNFQDPACFRDFHYFQKLENLKAVKKNSIETLCRDNYLKYWRQLATTILIMKIWTLYNKQSTKRILFMDRSFQQRRTKNINKKSKTASKSKSNGKRKIKITQKRRKHKPVKGKIKHKSN